MALKCPLCGGLACNRYAIHDNNSLKIVCNEFHRSVNLDVNIAACSDEIEKRKRGNLVLEHCLRESNDISRTWRYIYDHTYETTDNDVPHLVNIANVRYPNSFSEKVDRILLNLYRIHSDYADVITKNTKLAPSFLC